MIKTPYEQFYDCSLDNMLPKFFKDMDKQAKTAILVVVAMFAVVAIMAFLGKSALNVENGEYQRLFEAISTSEWVIPIILAFFVLGSFIGVPQWALIAGMVVAFGWDKGATGAWTCTLVSASVNFWLARWIGVERVRKFGGALINRITSVIRNNGFVTSFAIRLVPTGPFVLVNMAAGVSGMRYLHFLAGTALGIIPKILIVGLLVTGVVSEDQSSWIRVGIIALGLVFILAMLLARKRIRPLIEKTEIE